MDFEEKSKGYPENGGQEFIPNNEEEFMQAAGNMYRENKPAVKKGCAKLIVIAAAIFIGINILAAVLEPYTPLDEDGNKNSFSYAFAICLGLAFTVISLYMIIKKRITCSKKVTADIIGTNNQRNSSGGNMYKAVYEYYFNGMLYRTESKVSTAKAPKTNRKTTLRINPNNPDEIFDKSFILFLMCILAMGLFITVASMIPILPALFNS